MEYVEKGCTIQHEGRTFESGGAIVTPAAVFVYLAKDGKVTDWHGQHLGTYSVRSSWPIRSYVTDRMYSVDVFIDGVRYVGRSAGVGMCCRAKRAAKAT